MGYRKTLPRETRANPMPPPLPRRFTDIAVMALMPLFFSSNLVLGRAAVAEVEPWTLATLRWSVALVILLPFTLRQLHAFRHALVREWRVLGILGVLGMVICGGVVYLGLARTTATNAILIYTSSTVMILILERVFRGRPVTGRQALGVVLAFAGVGVIVLRGDLARLFSLELNSGDLLIAAAALSWAVYSVVLRKSSLGRIPTLPLFAAIVIAGVGALAPFMAWESWRSGAFPATMSAWAAIGGLALFPSVLAFSFYNYGVQRFGPAANGMLLYLMPAYGVLMSVLFLGESFRPFHLAGLLLVLPGVVLATAPPEVFRRAWRRM
ncbi:DMT family transporter [Faunimonas sp. B44]|uniref:DMT family transporter n=1 Tax=Faunimonas sp. B44 TaxID=3461493 RepID=UPI00404456AE